MSRPRRHPSELRRAVREMTRRVKGEGKSNEVLPPAAGNNIYPDYQTDPSLGAVNPQPRPSWDAFERSVPGLYDGTGD